MKKNNVLTLVLLFAIVLNLLASFEQFITKKIYDQKIATLSKIAAAQWIVKNAQDFQKFISKRKF